MAKKPPSPRNRAGTKSPTARGAAGKPGGVVISGAAQVDGHLVGGDMIIMSGSPPAREPAALSPEIDAYVSWRKKQPMGLSLIGVGGGDMPLDLDAVYVPLSLRAGLTSRPRPGKRDREEFEECGENFELTDLFVRIATKGFRHAVLLGRAGTGKTTALKKLVQLCLPPPKTTAETGPATIHLPPGYVPLLVFLRRFTDADLDRPLTAFLRAELTRDSRGELSEATLDALFSGEQGGLLVLLDGLDEIADPVRRARFCEHLARQLPENGCEHLRIVMTSRPAGHDPNAARLGRHFAAVSLEPLGKEQVPDLVHRWFGEATRKLGDHYPQSKATDDATQLVDALTGSKFGRDLQIMFSTPLFLTLLCVIVQQGKAMPSSRAIFYQECLHVLLERWHLGKDSESGPVAAPREHSKEGPEAVSGRLQADVAIDVLRPIAYRLHAAGEREDEDEDELASQLHDRLEALGRSETADDVLVWLRDRAAVLVEFGKGKLGFFHLNVQEYLAARHIVDEGGDPLKTLSAQFDKTWWHETARLVVSIGSKQVFSELIGPLLDGPHLFNEALREVLRECFLAAREIDLELVLDRLDGKAGPQEPARLIALLGLMRGLERGRRDPRFIASVRELAARTTNADLKAAALFAVSDVQASELPPKEWDVAVLALEDDDADALALEKRLEGPGHLRVWRGGRYSEVDRLQLADKVSAVVLLIGSAPWPSSAGKLKMIRNRVHRIIGVVAPGATAPLPEMKLDGVVNCREDWRDAEIVTLLRPRVSGPREHEAFVESVTGMRLVWVPGGPFKMGSEELDEDSRPVHPVWLNPYWIGETPVTNRQYEVFLRAQPKQSKPSRWNHPDFSDPEQPVVGVRWDDAMAFCVWLSEAAGLQVDLPSEAQWEFAARGPDNLPYPWGDSLPDATRACFAQTKPALVGSFPAGRGPYGTLDQAGNVWEWCKDVWDAGAYKTKVHQGAPLDPLVETGNKDFRCLRGGSFYVEKELSAQGLAAAFRDRHWRDVDDGGYGFRVVVVAASRPSRA